MPRTEEQNKELREKSKNLIIETSLKLFSTNGFHSTSIQTIAKEAGIAVGLLYNYFGSKEELLEEIIKNSLGEFNNSLYSVARDKDLMNRENLAKLLEAFFEALKNSAEAWRLYLKIMLEPDLARIGHKYIGGFYDHMETVFTQYFQNRGEPNPEKKAKILNALLHGIFLSYIMSQDEEIFELMKKEVLESYLIG